MASRGRPTAELVLTEEEHETLTRWARRRKSSQALALRSRIVLACAQGLTNMDAIRRNLGTAKQACEIADVAPSTLRNWLRQGLISAVRVGNGPYPYDLDKVAAMRVEYPCASAEQRIRELVDATPEFTL